MKKGNQFLLTFNIMAYYILRLICKVQMLVFYYILCYKQYVGIHLRLLNVFHIPYYIHIHVHTKTNEIWYTGTCNC